MSNWISVKELLPDPLSSDRISYSREVEILTDTGNVESACYCPATGWYPLNPNDEYPFEVITHWRHKNEALHS